MTAPDLYMVQAHALVGSDSAIFRALDIPEPEDAAERAAALDEVKKLGRTIAVVSTGEFARDRIALDPKGWRFKNFRSNPVVLVRHRGIPVGRAKVKRVRLDDDGPEVVVADIEWDMDDPEGERMAGKYHRGFMKAFSVGFEIDYSRFKRAADLPDGHPFKRESGWYSGRHDLLEISAAAVPVDTGAVAREIVARATRDTGTPEPGDDVSSSNTAPDEAALRAQVLEWIRTDPDFARAVRLHSRAARAADPAPKSLEPDWFDSWTTQD